MFEDKVMPGMRSNKVWDEETAGVIGFHGGGDNNENNERRNKKIFFEVTDKKIADENTNEKIDGDRGLGSLDAAEAVQAATEERRGKEVTTE